MINKSLLSQCHVYIDEEFFTSYGGGGVTEKSSLIQVFRIFKLTSHDLIEWFECALLAFQGLQKLSLRGVTAKVTELLTISRF